VVLYGHTRRQEMPKRTPDPPQHRQNPPNSEYFSFREGVDLSSTFRFFAPKPEIRFTKTVDAQRLTFGQLWTEIGPDVSKFPSAKHFASWLHLCPDNRISGGRILSAKTGEGKNRAATALCIAAASLFHSQTALGHFLRRMCAKLGGQQGVVATAHKLALIIYHMLKSKQPYDETRFAYHEEQNKRRIEIRLKHQAKAMGFTLVPV
jgi:transposase